VHVAQIDCKFYFQLQGFSKKCLFAGTLHAVISGFFRTRAYSWFLEREIENDLEKERTYSEEVNELSISAGSFPVFVMNIICHNDDHFADESFSSDF
jgi:hypothetical protein